MNMFGIVNFKLLSFLKPKFWNFDVGSIRESSKYLAGDNPYMIVRATKDDQDAIINLMWESFYPKEPVMIALSLGHRRNPMLDDRAIKALSEGFTLLAKCKYNGNIVGGCINCTSCPWDPDLLDKFACTITNPQTRQLYHFIAHIQRTSQLWQTYKVQKIFELGYLFVKETDIQKGIASRLVKASRNLGVDCGYSVVRIDSTNCFTARICEKLGFKLVYHLPYCTYLGANMEPVFRPPPPHHSFKTFIDTTLIPIKKKSA